LSRARGPLTASIIHTSFVALVLLSACGRTEVEEEFLTRTVEDGVTVVTNLPGIPIGSPVFTFEPILTLNEDPANEESLLARASYQFGVGDNGWYYVPDLRLYDIAVFDSEGEFIKRSRRVQVDLPAAGHRGYDQHLRFPESA